MRKSLTARILPVVFGLAWGFSGDRAPSPLAGTADLPAGVPKANPGNGFAMASLFQNGMVLQRDRKIPVWGTAAAGQEVVVRFEKEGADPKDGTAVQEMRTIARGGSWKIHLEPRRAGGPYRMTVRSGGRVVLLKNILMGDVFLGGGQSNMAFQLKTADGTKALLASISNGWIRHCTVPRVLHEGDGTNEAPVWMECTSQNAPQFSAVLYHFGAHLQSRLGVPIGLVNLSHGNTLAECYIQPEVLLSMPQTRPVWESYQAFLKTDYKAALDETYLKELEKYLEVTATNGKAKRPKAVYGGPYSHRRPGGLFEFMLRRQVGPFPFKGAVWYQAEANAREERGWQFRYILGALVESWRGTLEDPGLPFLFVQPPAFQDSMVQGPAWAETRESIRLAAETIPGCAMAVALDLPGKDPKNIHPERKEPIGYRLSLAARRLIYGESNLISSGPVFVSASFSPGRGILTFSEKGSGLVLSNENGSAFTVCEKDGLFKPAKARLEGESVVVESDEVSSPVAVRYGWFNFGRPTLYNKEGLPASPFRSDDFPMESLNNLEIKGTSSEH